MATPMETLHAADLGFKLRVRRGQTPRLDRFAIHRMLAGSEGPVGSELVAFQYRPLESDHRY